MKIDSKEIERALRAFFLKRDVFEIRCLGAVTTSKGYTGYPHVESGYFDFEHINEIAASLEHIKFANGVYVTINPVHEALLNRANNRIRNAKHEPVTKDDEIIKRQWLLIDCDPIRPTGIPSSDEEHTLALMKAEEIKEGLSSICWPDPIEIDSGNGAHLFYAIDVPTEDNGLIRNVIKNISYAGDSNVEIDTTVFNASRIVRLPGTFNCKGDSTELRPHRMAKILSIPKDIEFVSMDLLEKVAKANEEKTVCHIIENESYGDFNIDTWISQYCPELGNSVTYKDGRKWIFPECPFNPDHKAPDSALYQRSNGAIAFKCSHNHCSQYDWHSLRDLREPDWRTKRLPVMQPGVNIDGMLTPKEADLYDVPEDEIKEKDDYLPFPKELYNVKGFIGKVMNFTLENAPVPNKALALSGALSLISFLVARKVKTHTGLRGNIYILALAESGAGKERPRNVNQLILESIGLDNCILENVASGEGLEDLLVKNNALFWQCDEFYSVLHDMSLTFADNRNSLMKYLLTLYTSANKNFMTRAKVNKECINIIKPHLTLYASTTPNGFFENLTERFLNDGMFSRLNIIIADTPQKPKIKSEVDVPEDMISFAKEWRDFRPTGSGNIDIEAMLVPCTASASEIETKIYDEQYEKMESIRKSDNPLEWKKSAWNRYYEITMRYALLYACSEASSPDKAVITPEAILWANKFVKWEIENKIHMTERKYYRNDFEKTGEFVINFMKAWHDQNGNKPMAGWQFNRKIKFVKEKKLLLENLISQKRLIKETIVTTGRPAEVYYLPQYAPNAKKE